MFAQKRAEQFQKGAVLFLDFQKKRVCHAELAACGSKAFVALTRAVGAVEPQGQKTGLNVSLAVKGSCDFTRGGTVVDGPRGQAERRAVIDEAAGKVPIPDQLQCLAVGGIVDRQDQAVDLFGNQVRAA